MILKNSARYAVLTLVHFESATGSLLWGGGGGGGGRGGGGGGRGGAREGVFGVWGVVSGASTFEGPCSKLASAAQVGQTL